MKNIAKILSVFFVVCLLFGFAACGNKEEAETPLSYVSYKMSSDTQVDTIKIGYKYNTIYSISSTLSFNLTDMGEEIVAAYNDAFDTQFADIKNHSDFATYTRNTSNGRFTMTLSFTDLDKTANADYVKGLEIYKDFKAGITLSAFEKALTNLGFTKVVD